MTEVRTPRRSEKNPQIIERGGLWNAFIFAVHGQSLLEVFLARCPEIAMRMRHAIESAEGLGRDAALAELHERLPTLDFSRDIMERNAPLLRVITVPPCGWSDLGTPHRVAQALERGSWAYPPGSLTARHTVGFLDLAAQHARVAVSRWRQAASGQ
ncbi:MAG: hypothetical protein ACREV5_20600 [Steroidobacter sp.]